MQNVGSAQNFISSRLLEWITILTAKTNLIRFMKTLQQVIP